MTLVVVTPSTPIRSAQNMSFLLLYSEWYFSARRFVRNIPVNMMKLISQTLPILMEKKARRKGITDILQEN